MQADSLRIHARRAAALGAALTIAVAAASPALAANRSKKLAKVNHIVVIYQENHSFDNLYGGWEGVTASRTPTPPTPRRSTRPGSPTPACRQNDVNLTSPPLPATCTDTTTGHHLSRAHSRTRPSRSTTTSRRPTTTCPAPGSLRRRTVCSRAPGLPGGCTRDLVHRFYQEQYQLDGGKQDRYVTGSDALGLTMGYYDTQKLPIYQYLHGRRTRATRSPTSSSSGIRRLVPEPPVADRRARHRRARAQRRRRRRPALGASTRTGCRRTTRSTPRRGHGALTRPLTAIVRRRPQRPAHAGPRVRRLRRQHDAAALSAVRAGYRRRQPAAAAERADDRRSSCPPRASTGPGTAGGWSNANGDVGAPGLDQRHRADVLRPERVRRARSTRTARTSCSSSTTSRSTTSRTTRRAPPPAPRTCATRQEFIAPRAPRRSAVQPEAGQLRQADRRGERAPRVRQRDAAAAATWST